jgi:hypothetical protein
MFHNYPLLELTRTKALTGSFRPISASAKRGDGNRAQFSEHFSGCMFLMQQFGRLGAKLTQIRCFHLRIGDGFNRLISIS